MPDPDVDELARKGIKRTACTVHTDGPTTACGRDDMCTRVIVKTHGKTIAKHWVCNVCRVRMKLPAHGVVIEDGRERPYRG